MAGSLQVAEEDEPDFRHAGIDLFLATDHQGRGLGPEAIRVAARYLFEVRGHHRLTIDPAAQNLRAIHAYERVGFRPGRQGGSRAGAATAAGDGPMDRPPGAAPRRLPRGPDGVGSHRRDRDRGVLHREAASHRVDGGADARQQLFQPGWRDLAVPAGGRHLVQPLVAGVGPLPVEPPLLRVAEPARLPHPVGRLGAHHQVPVEGGPSPGIEWQPGLDPTVNVGEGFRNVGWRLEGVPEHGQPPIGRRTCAALAAPATGSTQCHACPAMTASKARPAGSQPRTSIPRPRCRFGARTRPTARRDRRRAPGSRPPGTGGPRCRSRSRRRARRGRDWRRRSGPPGHRDSWGGSDRSVPGRCRTTPRSAWLHEARSHDVGSACPASY